MSKTLIFTATDNKIDNVKNLLSKIKEYCIDVDILVIDDINPEGQEFC